MQKRAFSKDRRPPKGHGKKEALIRPRLRSQESANTIPAGSAELSPTHNVIPLHQVLKTGVRFNVQTVSSLGKPLQVLTASQTAEWVAECAQEACSVTADDNDSKGRTSARTNRTPPIVEQYSVRADTIVEHGAQSLMQICLAAFAEHYPLVLSPDHVWLAIAYGAAKHIDENAEALRARFVSFEGKKVLTVRKDNAVMGNTPVHEWESDVFPEFSDQIRTHIGNDIHELLTAPFSTTSKAERAAIEITLMAATTKYFGFMLRTACGIPFLELEGTVGDWIAIRERAGRLREVLLPDFAQRWLPNLLPVLDEFVSACKGTANHAFWQRMVKVYNPNFSGATPVVSGWINNLYPYLADGKVNQYMKPWISTTQFCGPAPNRFPNLVSSVALKWIYFGKEFPLHLHAGYFGMTQDPDTLALRPYIGWVVTHDGTIEG